ncbi:D-alanyl-D-alanine carboxypeptidase family protein, partial [Streptomyces massasporeus]
RAGLQDPAFTRYCSTRYADFPAGSWSYGIANTNRLLTGADGVDRYPGLIGIKNGYTSNAGNTLISAARRGDRTLVVSVMNPQRGGGLAVYEEARELLDWGFDAAERVQPVGSLLPAPTVPAKAAAGSGNRTVAVARESREAKADSRPPRAGAEAAAAPAAAPAKDPARGEESSGASAGLPLALVGSACAAALALWALRRRTAHRAG